MYLKMIISITNQKGGVGKTITAINMAAGLAMQGYTTLLLDMDPQGHSTIAFTDSDEIALTNYEVLIGDVTFPEVIIPTKFENLYLAPARISLAKLESKLLGELDGHFRLKDKLQQIKGDYDFVIIDSPPSLGLITVNILVAASHVLIPIQSSYFSLEGTDDLLETIEKIKRRPNPGLQILGVLITIHDHRTVLGRDIVHQIKRVFGKKVFRAVISKSVRLEESPAYKESIFTFAPGSKGAKEYEQLCQEVINRVQQERATKSH